MPEGPEIYIAAELIRPLVIGKQLTSIHTTPNSRYGYSNLMPVCYQGEDTRTITIQSIDTKGKLMYWTFKDSEETKFWMFLTFGMSGQLSPHKGKHPCMEMKFSNANPIYFNDPRHFGTIKFVNTETELHNKLASLGWDAMQQSVEEGIGIVLPALQQTNKSIGQVLMDQSIFAGCGNYLRAEVLYAIKMSPWRISNQLSEEEVKTLCRVLKETMQASYKYQGATILTYKDAYGAEGKYSSQFKCYGQKTDPDGHPIIKEETPKGRTMHWCPSVQT